MDSRVHQREIADVCHTVFLNIWHLQVTVAAEAELCKYLSDSHGPLLQILFKFLL